jgi:hypothetical protein
MTFEIKSTLRDAPVRAVFYGTDGVGKSTLCAGAPGAIFIPVEDGLSNIDTRSTPRPTTWTQLIQYVDALVVEPSCKSIVVDSIDEAEALCWDHTCLEKDEKGKVRKNIEAFGYGKGYIAAINTWRQLLAALERADDAGKNVLLIAHTHRKTVKNPNGEDYEQWQIKLHEKAAGLFREWARVVAFCELDIVTNTDKDDGGRTKGIWTGKRVIRVNPSAGFQGKSRYMMPDSVPLDWDAFSSALAASKVPNLDSLASILNEKLVELGDEKVTIACAEFIAKRGRTLSSITDATARVNSYLEKK